MNPNDVPHDELVARMDFLQRRTMSAHAPGFRWTGLSSDALVRIGLGWQDSTAESPGDWADLLACEISFERATPTMRERMTPWLEQWRTQVLADYEPSDPDTVLVAVGAGWVDVTPDILGRCPPGTDLAVCRQVYEHATPMMRERMRPLLTAWLEQNDFPYRLGAPR